MKNLFYLFIISTLVTTSSELIAQNKKKSFALFEVGAEGGVTKDYLTIRDAPNNMRQGSYLISGMGGVKLRAYLNSGFFLETAVLFKENAFGFQFIQEGENGGWSTNGSEIFMIPIRTGYEWKFSDKISLNAIAGIVPTFITLHGGLSGYGTSYPANISYNYQMKDEYKKTYLALQPGLSLRYLIKKRINFSAGVNYYHGLSDAELYDVSYSINNGPINNAIIANRGSFLNFNFGVNYKFRLK